MITTFFMKMIMAVCDTPFLYVARRINKGLPEELK